MQHSTRIPLEKLRDGLWVTYIITRKLKAIETITSTFLNFKFYLLINI